MLPNLPIARTYLGRVPTDRVVMVAIPDAIPPSNCRDPTLCIRKGWATR